MILAFMYLYAMFFLGYEYHAGLLLGLVVADLIIVGEVCSTIQHIATKKYDSERR